MALDLVAAVRENDLVAVADLVAPDDVAGVPDLVRALGDVASGFGYEPRDNGSGLVDGVTVPVEDVTTRADLVADDVAVVDFTGGTGRGILDPTLSTGPLSALSNIRYDESNPVDFGGREFPSIVTVRQDGRWFVSLSGTWLRLRAAEAGRGVDTVAGQWTHSPESVSFDSPESAVSGFFDAAVTFLNGGSIEPLAAALSPMQGRTLLAYRDTFENDLRSNDLTSFDVEYSDIVVEETDWGARASVDGLVVSGVDDGSSFEASVSGACAVESSGGDAVCVDEGFDGFPVSVSSSNIVVRESLDGWVVDPLGSVTIGPADRVRASSPEQTAVRWGGLMPDLVSKLESVDEMITSGENEVYLDAELVSGSPWFMRALGESEGAAVVEVPIRNDKPLVVAMNRHPAAWVSLYDSGEFVAAEYSADREEETWTFERSWTTTARLIVRGPSGPATVTIR